ncbi:glycoside hydrolase family 105 protein [Glaciecola siphonariae]|uniref:Glycoside hydrolase family 105 protein n=1 Tax=Glaciecola siphonariae TaxID=521012 RepID=A0ABV9LXS1_9ALTE
MNLLTKLSGRKRAFSLGICMSLLLPNSVYAVKTPHEQDMFDQASHPSQVEYLVQYQTPAAESKSLSSDFNAQALTQVAEQVANWQLAQFDIRSNKMRPEMRPSGIPNGWMYATLHLGLWRWAEQVDDAAYKQAVLNLSQLNNFELGPRVYHADDHAVGDVYLSLYQVYGGENKISHLKHFFNTIVDNPDQRSFDFEVKERDVHTFALRTFKDPWCTRRWCWADAAFMSPPVFAHLAKVTGDKRYLDFMHKEFWEMTNYLFDQDYGLYLRDSRYFTRKDEQGRPIFWGRGNGWVLAGIARTIEYLPKDDPRLPEYKTLFINMSNTLLKYQNEDGSWPSSLLEAGSDAHSETSATALLAFALAWGVNNQLLTLKQFFPAIERAWTSIVTNIHNDGKVGYVQQVAFAPGSATKDDTQLYGSGAVLLAAAELHKLSQTLSKRSKAEN